MSITEVIIRLRELTLPSNGVVTDMCNLLNQILAKFDSLQDYDSKRDGYRHTWHSCPEVEMLLNYGLALAIFDEEIYRKVTNEWKKEGIVVENFFHFLEGFVVRASLTINGKCFGRSDFSGMMNNAGQAINPFSVEPLAQYVKRVKACKACNVA